MSEPSIMTPGAQNNVTRAEINPDIRDALIKHYNLEAVPLEPKFSELVMTNADVSLLEKFEYTDNEINPFHAGDIKLNYQGTKEERVPSYRNFSDEKMSFARLEELLCDSYASYDNKRRPYPSAGAMYPIDVFVVVMPSRLKGVDIKSGIYQFRPIARVLQPLLFIDEAVIRKNILRSEFDLVLNPHFIVMYSMQLSKAVVKYNYRGYRNATIEVGLMAQQSGIVAQEMDLGACLWGGFSEHHLRQFLQLDPFEHLPLMLQFFGERDV